MGGMEFRRCQDDEADDAGKGANRCLDVELCNPLPHQALYTDFTVQVHYFFMYDLQNIFFSAQNLNILSGGICIPFHLYCDLKIEYKSN